MSIGKQKRLKVYRSFKRRIIWFTKVEHSLQRMFPSPRLGELDQHESCYSRYCLPSTRFWRRAGEASQRCRVRSQAPPSHQRGLGCPRRQPTALFHLRAATRCRDGTGRRIDGCSTGTGRLETGRPEVDKFHDRTARSTGRPSGVDGYITSKLY